MKTEVFMRELAKAEIDTFIGIPDSALRNFCDYMNGQNEKNIQHFVPENEGAAIGIAIGNYLATGKAACVYMQNSGIGNAVNPLTSLANEEVYDIPMLLLIGWRGKPDEKDEPQHKFMGKITPGILDTLAIAYSVISSETTEEELAQIFSKAKWQMQQGKQYAMIAQRDTFEADQKTTYGNSYEIIREDAITALLKSIGSQEIIVSTTGKISREVYEQSDRLFGKHSQCFLTVGGMGHASMIAFGIAVKQPDRKVYCIEGDGAIMMHMGAMAFLGKQKPDNMIHICLNNEAHESVGGMPTGAAPDYWKLAKELGYPQSYVADSYEGMPKIWNRIAEASELTFVEIKVALSSRKDLGRPKESAVQNKMDFMKNF